MLSSQLCPRRRERGYVLVTAGIGSIVMVSMVGLSVDLGRSYIAKNESQTFADAASMAAALELDGTTTGLTDARNAVSNSVNRWNLGQSSFTNPTVEFATAQTGPWLANPATGAGYRFVRVTAGGDVDLLFLNLMSSRSSTRVNAQAIAGQVPKTTFREAVFPFSPFAPSPSSPPSYGFRRASDLPSGQQDQALYTLRWPANPRMNGANANVCPGDRNAAVVNMATSLNGSERGYIEETSSSTIASTIVDDYQSITRSVGDPVTFTGGAKQNQLSSLNTRIAQDTDNTSVWYADYVRNGNGNGRRIVPVLINDGGIPTVGTNQHYIGIASFFLRPTGDYGNGGNQAWCAEYIGGWTQGSRKPSVGDGTNGAFVVRLVG